MTQEKFLGGRKYDCSSRMMHARFCDGASTIFVCSTYDSLLRSLRRALRETNVVIATPTRPSHTHFVLPLRNCWRFRIRPARNVPAAVSHGVHHEFRRRLPYRRQRGTAPTPRPTIPASLVFQTGTTKVYNCPLHWRRREAGRIWNRYLRANAAHGLGGFYWQQRDRESGRGVRGREGKVLLSHISSFLGSGFIQGGACWCSKLNHLSNLEPHCCR